MARVIDAVGGIDLYLPADVDGRSYHDSIDLGYWEAGYHHFDGEEAVRFSRVRAVDGVYARMNRQTMVLYALQEKILNPAVLPRIPKIISSFRDSVISDLTPGELAVLACLAPQITKDKLMFASLPQSLLKGGSIHDPHLEHDVFIWEANFEAINQLLAHFQAGTWPTQ
jgi:anionic cell wall polymer biosynthesis LytR-Cps2A-Psr (LCP) family protein